MKELTRIFRFTKSLWPYYVGVSAFSILVAAASQVQPLLTKPAIDEMTKLIGGQHANVKLVAILAILIFAADLAGTLFANIGGFIGDMLSAKLQRFMSLRYYEHLLSLPQRYFDTELSGKIINRMNRGISQISTFTQVFSNNFLQFIFSTVFSLAIIAHYSWEVALMLFALYPIFIFLTGKTSNKWQNYQKEINQEQDVATGRFAEAIGQVRVVKSFLQEKRELSFFHHRFDKIVNTTRPQSLFWHKQDVWRRLVLNLIFLAVFVFVFVETARGRYTVGTMVLLIQYAMLIRIPIFSISFLVDNTQRAIANTKDYFEVMDVRPEITDRPDAKKLVTSQAEISFENVTFGYKHDEPVLRDINLTIKPDTKVALVGESGEGKTTLTNLVLRLYEVTKGAVRIDGQDINEVTQESLRKNIGIVFQEPALFSGTIRENITYANPHASKAQVVAAAKAANAHEFIQKFEKGYDTEIGERGLRLSGGQKQRLAIARALLKDAPILILDEATSSLDSKSEQMVQEALERLMKGRTTLIIAHRLSTIQNVDQIITLRGGRVDEIGSPEELSKSDGIYAQLLKLQQGHTTTDKKKLKEYEIAG
ncbi:MAG TPA: ABC transporter ATP-binding protein [Candidatus Saccharimonadales bacterium]|nr:ABC transporter ATP-binding protein [Candidatus Saccharimonadales bacterium]